MNEIEKIVDTRQELSAANRDVVYEISNDPVVTESIEAAVAEQKEKRKKRKISRQT